MTEITTTITAPDSAMLTSAAQQALDLARGIVIDSDPMLQVAAGELQTVKSRYAMLEAQRVGITKPLLNAKRAVDDLFRVPLERMAEAEGILKSAINGYQRRVEDQRRAEAARLAEIARKEAAKLAEQAARAEAAGKVEKAAELAARAEAATMVQVAPVEAPKAAGISTRKAYKATVTDKMALLQFVIANPMFANLVAVDDAALNAMARAQKDAFALPGCRLVVEDIVSARAA